MKPSKSKKSNENEQISEVYRNQVSGQQVYKKPARLLSTLLMRCILANYSEAELIDEAKKWKLENDNLKITAHQARKLIADAARRLARYQEHNIDITLQKNLEKVQYIIDNALEEKKYKTVLDAISLLQKCSSQNKGNEVQILTKDEVVKINFSQ